MQVSVTDAQGQFTDLVGRAEAGEEIILTRGRYPRQCALLFVGNDFAQTDVQTAIPP